MIPNPRWYPTGIQERAAWGENFITQLGLVANSLGLSVAEITQLTTDSQVMTELANAMNLMDSYMTALRNFRNYVTEGNVGDPNPEFPVVPTFSVPTTPTGIFERLDAAVKRIRASANYTPEIGGLLGIIPAATVRPAPEDMEPVIKAESMPGSVVNVSFKRKFTNGIAVEIKVDNAATWAEAGRFFGSPAQVVIPENPQNLPRSVQVRARYVEGNTPVGQYSQTATVATQPSS